MENNAIHYCETLPWWQDQFQKTQRHVLLPRTFLNPMFVLISKYTEKICFAKQSRENLLPARPWRSKALKSVSISSYYRKPLGPIFPTSFWTNGVRKSNTSVFEYGNFFFLSKKSRMSCLIVILRLDTWKLEKTVHSNIQRCSIIFCNISFCPELDHPDYLRNHCKQWIISLKSIQPSCVDLFQSHWQWGVGQWCSNIQQLEFG